MWRGCYWKFGFVIVGLKSTLYVHVNFQYVSEPFDQLISEFEKAKTFTLQVTIQLQKNVHLRRKMVQNKQIFKTFIFSQISLKITIFSTSSSSTISQLPLDFLTKTQAENSTLFEILPFARLNYSNNVYLENFS